MIVYKSQMGIGLIEVMVSLLLLAVAVLGFSALQIQAVKATEESLTRSTAVSAMRNLSEDMRLNTNQKRLYYEKVSGAWSDVSVDAETGSKTVLGYCQQVATLVPSSCNTDSCTPQEQVEYNAYKSMKAVCDSDMMMNAIACPQDAASTKSFDPGSELLPKLCLIVSWDDTLPEVELDDATNAKTACIDSMGAYKRGSSCLVMETY